MIVLPAGGGCVPGPRRPGAERRRRAFGQSLRVERRGGILVHVCTLAVVGMEWRM